MWCLTVATNAIVCWSTEYHGLAVAALRRTGRDVDDEVLAHIMVTFGGSDALAAALFASISAALGFAVLGLTSAAAAVGDA